MTVYDRRSEEWPTANLGRDQEFLPQTPTEATKMDVLRRAMADPPPVTPIGQQLGVDDIMRMQEFQKLITPDLYGSYSPSSTGVRAGEFPKVPEMPPVKFSPPEPQGYSGPMPNIAGNRMGITLPTASGDFSARGSYSPNGPRLELGYRRQF